MENKFKNFINRKDKSSSLASSNSDWVMNAQIQQGTTQLEGFLCPQCFAAFPDARKLTDHFSSKHSTFVNDSSSVNCPHCKMKLDNKKDLKNHVDKYHKLPTAQTSAGPVIAQLDQSTTKHLTDTFSQDLHSAFNNSSVNKSTADLDHKMITVEEFDLLQRQQKELEETKNLLLNELSLLRAELNKKDNFIETLKKDFQDKRSLWKIQLNEASQPEKTMNKNIDHLKNEILMKDEEMTSMENAFKNHDLNKQKLEDEVSKLKNENSASENPSEQLKNESQTLPTTISELKSQTLKKSKSFENLNKEKAYFNHHLSQMIIKADSVEKQNDLLEKQVKCLQMKSSDSAEHAKQIEEIEQLRKQELNDLRSKITNLEADKLKMNDIFVAKICKYKENFDEIINKLNNFKDLNSDNLNLIHEYKQMMTDTIKDLTEQNAQLERNNQKKMTDLIQQEDYYKDLNSTIFEKLDSLENDLLRTRIKVKQKEGEIKKYSQIDARMKMYQMKLKESQKIIQISKIEELNLKGRINDLNLQLDNMGKSYKKQMLESKKLIDAMKIFKENLKLCRSKMDDIQTDHSSLCESVSEFCLEMRQQFPNLQHYFDRFQENCATKIHQLEQANDKLKNEYDDVMKVTLPEKEAQIEKLTKAETLMKTYVESTKTSLKDMKTKNEQNEKQIAQLKTEKSQLLVDVEKEKARYENALQVHDQVLGEKLKLETELSTFMEGKRALLERCVAAEEKAELSERELSDLSMKLDENSKAVHELGIQNQTLQIKLDEANQKLKRSWIDDHLVDNCMNDKCQKQFTSLIRKHHCRLCGKIFCYECSTKQMQMTGHPKPVRVCDECYEELNEH